MDAGGDVIGELDTYGAAQVQRSMPDSVRIFLTPPSMEALEKRLRDRGTEDDAGLKRRIAAAKHELSAYETYSYIVFNDDAERAAEEIVAIIAAEKAAVPRNEELIQALLK
jgi:guanylate kinase